MSARTRRRLALAAVFLAGVPFIFVMVASAFVGGSVRVLLWDVPRWTVAAVGVPILLFLMKRLTDPRHADNRRIAHEMGYGATSFLMRRR